MPIQTRKSKFRNQLVLGLAIVTSLFVVFIHRQLISVNEVLSAEPPTQLADTSLPAAQTHPLPSTLTQWQDTHNSGDYFSQVKPTPVGYLVWSQFPVKVYVEQPTSRIGTPATDQAQKWVSAVLAAVQEWAVYLPLEVVEQADSADIKISRSSPALKPSFNRNRGEFNLPRARSAETRYEFYISQQAILRHKFTIQLSPTQTGQYIQAAARHELGHALGVWGHSPLETDALYFSQVRNPAQISPRDVNTLKRVYQQPTQLGWPLTIKN